MRLPSISRSQFSGARLRSILRRPAALVDRGVEAASEVGASIEQLTPTHRGRSRRQTAVTVAAVAVGAAAAGTADPVSNGQSNNGNVDFTRTSVVNTCGNPGIELAKVSSTK